MGLPPLLTCTLLAPDLLQGGAAGSTPCPPESQPNPSEWQCPAVGWHGCGFHQRIGQQDYGGSVASIRGVLAGVSSFSRPVTIPIAFRSESWTTPVLITIRGRSVSAPNCALRGVCKSADRLLAFWWFLRPLPNSLAKLRWGRCGCRSRDL